MFETLNTRTLTMKELCIYNLLRSKCAENCRENEVTDESWPMILGSCNLFSLAYELSPRMRATEAIKALQSLLQKGFVAEFRAAGMIHSYVPFGYLKGRGRAVMAPDSRRNCLYMLKFMSL
jgi:hypothetical protein